MKELHKDQYSTDHFEPKEGQRRSLCSNKTGKRCPSFGIYPNSLEMSEDVLLKYLAGILVDAFLDLKNYDFIEE